MKRNFFVCLHHDFAWLLSSTVKSWYGNGNDDDHDNVNDDVDDNVWWTDSLCFMFWSQRN